ncbi:hypothetical protein B0H13DRAFT_2359861 [Mycena leptocephala]|nr:hypothetical protein B0H13DRAFT_2359861 [Mycena leptocephala]
MRVRPLPSNSTPMLKRTPPHSFRTDRPDAEGSAAATRASSSVPRFIVQGVYPLDAWQSCYTVLERVCCTQFELILRPRSDSATNDASICPHRSPTPTQREPPTHTSDASAEYTTSGWPSYRARRPPFPSTPLSAARPRILNVVLRVAWARRRCTIVASPPLNDEPAPYLHAQRRCSCASCNRNCRLSTSACYCSYPLVCAYSRFHWHPTAFHSRVRTFARQLPTMFRRIRSVKIFFERLSWSPFTRFPRSPPGLIP